MNILTEKIPRLVFLDFLQYLCTASKIEKQLVHLTIAMAKLEKLKTFKKEKWKSFHQPCAGQCQSIHRFDLACS